MIFKLTEEQLQWLLEGTGFGEKIINMYRDHYVKSIGKAEASKRNDVGFSFSTKKWSRFETLVLEKCKSHNLEISTIMHSLEDKNAVQSFDISKKQKGQE